MTCIYTQSSTMQFTYCVHHMSVIGRVTKQQTPVAVMKFELEGKTAWELVKRPSGQAVLPGLWRFKVKRDENGDSKV